MSEYVYDPVSFEEPKKGVVIHVLRSDLPWREATRTECGKLKDDYAPGRVVGVTDARKMIERLGQQRASLFMCMTCNDTERRWPTWEENPVDRLRREFRWEEDFRFDLLALAALVERHPVEFAEIRREMELGTVVSIGELRRQRRGQ